MKGAAKISENRRYRYVLTRRWEPRPTPMLGYVMLNPSTADGRTNDPTIRRCIGFARREGFGSLAVTNLYALRATNPRELALFDDPMGPDNERWWQWMLNKCEKVVLAWGNSIRYAPKPEYQIEYLLEVLGYPFFYQPFCLGRTKTGNPRHPLMLSSGVELEKF